MSDVEGVLRRAKIRLRYHGWRRSDSDDKVPGWTLREAITGRSRKPARARRGFPSGEQGSPTSHELQALEAVAKAVGAFDIEGDDLEVWNDAPYRTVKDVLKAISRARKSVAEPPKTVPDRCAQRRMASGDMAEECTSDEGETMARLVTREEMAAWPITVDLGPGAPDLLVEVAEGKGPLEPLEEQVDLEEVIKDHLRGR